jgi:ribonuclease P protein subunit POP4
VPLHRLWLGYMSELLALSPGPPPPPLREKKSAEGEDDVASRATAIPTPQAAGMHVKLVKADFHGSIMTGQFLCFSP